MRGFVVTWMLPALTALASAWTPPLPTGVTGKPFYDTDAIHFNSPVWLGELPGLPGAFLVGEGSGGLRVLEPEGSDYKVWTFGSLPVAFTAGNDGLLGLAFHPGFAANGRYFAYYNPKKGEAVLEERQASADRRADAGNGRVLLRVALGGVVHNGGDMHFGPDGFLYLGLGDGGNPQVYNQRSQDLSLLQGKMLRIDVDHKDAGLEYAIPADNPHTAAAAPQARREIWAWGLRQPWRWSFDVDGRLLVGDVGDWAVEEVDLIKKGGNYGWSRMEGSTCFNGLDETHPLPTCDTAGLIAPIAVVTHEPISTGPGGCIIGGYVFRGDPASPFFGAYIFGDFDTGKLFALPWGGSVPQTIGTGVIGMSTFGMDARGNLYYANYKSGILYRLEHADLVGKGLGIRNGGKPRAARGPLGRRLEGQDFPGARSLAIAALDGRILRRYGATRLATGVEADVPPGLYLVVAETPLGSQAFPILLR